MPRYSHPRRSSQPELEARNQAALLKGRQCLVRWDPAHPGQKVVEIP
jgi:hypothetical protein